MKKRPKKCVGAGALVTKDVPDHALLMGKPAYRLGEKLNQALTCSACNKTIKQKSAPLSFVDLAA